MKTGGDNTSTMSAAALAAAAAAEGEGEAEAEAGEEEEGEDQRAAQAAPRKQKRAVWSVDDLKVLQQAKRHDQEKYLRGGRKEKQRSSAERWAKIAAVCAREGVRRTPGQCKQKWENLAVDWNKVADYGRGMGARKGVPAYWQMTSEERKSRGLPPSFAKDLFHLIEEWYPRCRAAILDPRLISDISDSAMSTSDSSAGQQEQAEEVGANGQEETVQKICGFGRGGRLEEAEDVGAEEPAVKKVKRVAWSVEDLLVLQAARRNEKERGVKSEVHRSVQESWAGVAAYCAANGLVRAADSCRQKWEQVATDWKKINEYEMGLEGGGCSYWRMSGEERKGMKLPFSFARGLFDAIGLWYPGNCRGGGGEKVVGLESGVGGGMGSLHKASFVSVDTCTTLRAMEAGQDSQLVVNTASMTTAPAQQCTPAAAACGRRGSPAVAMRSSLSELVPAMSPPVAARPGGCSGIPPPSAGPEVDWHFVQGCMKGIVGQLQRMAQPSPEMEQVGHTLQEMEARLTHRLVHLEGVLGGKMGSLLNRVSHFGGRIEELSEQMDVLEQKVDHFSGQLQAVSDMVENVEARNEMRFTDAMAMLKGGIAAVEGRAWARTVNACSSKAGDRVEPVPDENMNIPHNFPKVVEDIVKMSEADLDGLLEAYGLPDDGASSTRRIRLANYLGLRVTLLE